MSKTAARPETQKKPTADQVFRNLVQAVDAYHSSDDNDSRSRSYRSSIYAAEELITADGVAAFLPDRIRDLMETNPGKVLTIQRFVRSAYIRSGVIPDSTQRTQILLGLPYSKDQ